MDVYLFDNNLTVLSIVPDDLVTLSEQTQKHNDLITHSLKVIYSSTYDLDTCAYFGMRDVDDKSKFWIYKVVDRRKNSTDTQIELKGVHKFFDDLKGVTIRDIRPNNSDTRSAFDKILKGTGWELGTVNSKTRASTNYYYDQALDAFFDALEIWQVEFQLRMTFANGQVTGQYVDLSNQWSSNNGKWYEYGDKLLEVTETQSESNIYTALIGRGKAKETENGGYGRKITFKDVLWQKSKGDPVDKPLGQDYVELDSATAGFGYPNGKRRESVIEFNDIDDPEKLLDATYKALADISRPKQELEAEVLEDELAETGEVVSIIDPRYNIRYQTRIFELDRDFKNPRNKTIKFGDKVTHSAAERVHIEKQASEAKSEEQRQLIINQVNSTVLDDVQKKVEETLGDLARKDAYKVELEPNNKYHLPSGTYWFDAPIEEATSFVGATGGYIVSANSKKSDGSWDITYLAGGDGLLAETIGGKQIKGHSIGADHLEAGVLNTKNIFIGDDEQKTLDQKIAALDETDQANYSSLKDETEQALNEYQDAVLAQAEAEASAYADNVLTLYEQQALIDARRRLEEAKEYADAHNQKLESKLIDLIGQVDMRTHIQTDPVTGDVLIGKPDSGVQMRLTNDRLSIEMGGEEVAYFGNQQLYITEAVVVYRFVMGDDWEIQVSPDKNLNIMWIGGSE